MSAVVPHQPLFSNHLLYLVLFFLYVLTFLLCLLLCAFCVSSCIVSLLLSQVDRTDRGAVGLSARAWARCLSRRRGRCVPVPMTLSNLVLLFISVTLYFKIILLTILLSSVSSCGRSQVASEAGAWSLARADPFSPNLPTLCSLPVCFLFVLVLASGGIFHVPYPCGPPGLGGRGP